MSDARFEDGGEGPLNLSAADAEDLGVISALVQDAVFPASEMAFRAKSRQFALLLNRFRWEDRVAAERAGRGYERVQSVLSFRDVLAVRTQGIAGRKADTILSLLSIRFEPGPDGTGRVILILAGDGAIALTVEALDVALRDVSRPYLAPSGKAPDHGG
jgi:hypothetical protein